jgi:hypothetical protein
MGDILLNVVLNGGDLVYCKQQILFTYTLYFVIIILHYVLMYNKSLYLIMIVSSHIKSLHYDLRYVPLFTT